MAYIKPSWEEYFLNIARDVSKRGTCLRRRYGALIVKDRTILSTGYNGAASGLEDCLEKGYCIRQQLNIPSGTRYELCRSVHAEANALLNAAKNAGGIEGGILYLCGEEDDGKLADARPCSMCARVIVNAKIEKLIARAADNSIRAYTMDDLRKIADNFNQAP